MTEDSVQEEQLTVRSNIENDKEFVNKNADVNSSVKAPDRRKLFGRVVGLAALGGLTALLLGQRLPEARAGSTSGAVLFDDGSGTATEDDAQLHWDDTGHNLGIGTNTPSTQLEIASTRTDGGILIQGTGNGQGYSDLGLRIKNTAAGGTEWYLDSTGTASGYGGGKLVFVAPHGTGTPVMTLTPGPSTGPGWVGIGTINPSGQLHVKSTNALTALMVENSNGVAIQGNTSMPGGNGVHGYSPGLPESNAGIGVAGESGGYWGVLGVGGSVGVVGKGSVDTAKSIVAQASSPTQSGNLQEWQDSGGNALSAVDASGRLGVGTGSPGFTIHGVNPAADGALTLECYSSVGPIPRVNTRTSRGTPTSPSPSQSGDRLFQLSGYGRSTSAFSSLGSIALIGWCAENFTDTTQGAYLAFWTTPIGSPSTARAERMRIDSNGNVGIGITSPAQKLDVTGNIHLTGTVMTGDIEFKNGIRATEDGAGLAFKNKSGKKIALLDDDGNLHIKGDLIKDL